MEEERRRSASSVSFLLSGPLVDFVPASSRNFFIYEILATESYRHKGGTATPLFPEESSTSARDSCTPIKRTEGGEK